MSNNEHADTFRYLTDMPSIGWEPHRGAAVDALTRHQQLEQRACAELGFLFAMYHTETWWFELLDLLRKFILTGAIMFLEKGSAAQLAVAITASFVMLSTNLSLRPVFDVQINRIANLAVSLHCAAEPRTLSEYRRRP